MSTHPVKQNISWLVFLVLAGLLLAFTVPLVLLSDGTSIFEQGLKYTGSILDISTLDPEAMGFIKLAMLKPLWEEIWIGLFGIHCALGLKKLKQHCWSLGLGWGIMLIVFGTIQGFYEVVILSWKAPCAQSYLFFGLGILGVISLLFARR